MPIPSIFDSSDQTIKNDVNIMILQYLEDNNLNDTANTIRNELNMKISETAITRY